jgi:hypothetical protein
LFGAAVEGLEVLPNLLKFLGQVLFLELLLLDLRDRVGQVELSLLELVVHVQDAVLFDYLVTLLESSELSEVVFVEFLLLLDALVLLVGGRIEVSQLLLVSDYCSLELVDLCFVGVTVFFRLFGGFVEVTEFGLKVGDLLFLGLDLVFEFLVAVEDLVGLLGLILFDLSLGLLDLLVVLLKLTGNIVFGRFQVGEVGVSGVEELALLVVVVGANVARELFELNLAGFPLEKDFSFLEVRHEAGCYLAKLLHLRLDVLGEELVHFTDLFFLFLDDPAGVLFFLIIERGS